MKTAIIGSRGFLGKHFMEALPDATGFHRGNASDFSHIDYSDWPWSDEYDLILHCALPFHDVIQQSQIDTNIIRWWRDYQKNAILVTFGTDVGYSAYKEHSEVFYGLDEPYRDWYHYAMAKRAAVNLMLSVPDRQFYHFILTSLFGPGFDLRDEHLVHSLVKKIVNGKTYGTLAKVGQVNDIKECIYVNDLVHNVLEVLNLDPEKRCSLLNLGSPMKNGTIWQIITEICKIVDYPLANVHPDPDPVIPHSRKWLDSSRAKELLEEKYADTPWNIALEETIKYYMTVQPCKSP